MLEYAWYYVISPESCSSILYRDPNQGKKSAEALKLTAKDLSGFGIIDEILPEPAGGAHRDPDAVGEDRRRGASAATSPISRSSRPSSSSSTATRSSGPWASSRATSSRPDAAGRRPGFRGASGMV